MRARYYNPHIRRFINPDPIGFAGGMNWYAYADGNPISYLDPFGLASVGESTGNSWLNPSGLADSPNTWDQFRHALLTGNTWWQAPLYTGQWNPSPEVLDEAITAAGDYVFEEGAVRGFVVGTGVAGKLDTGTYQPAYVVGGELSWTIEDGVGGQLLAGGGLQMRGRTTVLGLGTTPFVSEQIGLAGTYQWNQASGGFLQGTFGASVYGGQANRTGGYAFDGSLTPGNSMTLGITYGNVGFGIIVDRERLMKQIFPKRRQ